MQYRANQSVVDSIIVTVDLLSYLVVYLLVNLSTFFAISLILFTESGNNYHVLTFVVNSKNVAVSVNLTILLYWKYSNFVKVVIFRKWC